MLRRSGTGRDAKGRWGRQASVRQDSNRAGSGATPLLWLLSVEADNSYPERFQYLKFFWLVLLLVALVACGIGLDLLLASLMLATAFGAPAPDSGDQDGRLPLTRAATEGQNA